MKKIIFSLTLALLVINVGFTESAPKKGEKQDLDSKVIATVGNEKITYKMLEKAFRKNTNRKNAILKNVPKDSILDFLNLYVNYRLKVQDALRRGFEKDSSVLNDIKSNRKILAESFYYEKMLSEPHIDYWLKMREKEYKVAVIITAFGQNGDTTLAYTKIQQALKELESGQTFESVAMKYSDDTETAKNGGVVPAYITAGKVNRTIEDAIFKLSKDQYTKEYLRTRFGFFLVKVIDEQPREYRKLRTILLEYFSEEEDAPMIKKLADSLVAVLRAGKNDFATLAKEFSKDNKSAKEGGYVGGPYSRSTGVNLSGDTFLPEIEEAFLKLKPGQITDPIHIQNALHIFTVDSIMPIDKIAEKDELRSLYRRLYFNEDKRIILDSLAKAFGFRINVPTLNELVALMDTSKTTIDSNWTKSITPSIRNMNLFMHPTTIEEKSSRPVSVGEFVDVLQSKPEYRGTATSFEGFSRAIDKMIEPKVFETATENLEKTHPDFEELVKEFRDGILLFKVEALEVWDKMKFDSAMARKYYDTTKADLTKPDMFDISEIYVLNDSIAKDLYSKIKSGELEFNKAASENTQRAGMRAKSGALGKLSPAKNKLAQMAKDRNAQTGDLLEPFPYEKGFAIIKINSFEPSRRKTFEEAVSEIAPKVQDVVQKNLTNEWLKRVRKDFPVKIDNKAIDAIR